MKVDVTEEIVSPVIASSPTIFAAAGINTNWDFYCIGQWEDCFEYQAVCRVHWVFHTTQRFIKEYGDNNEQWVVIDTDEHAAALNAIVSKDEAESWAFHHNGKVTGNGGDACYVAMSLKEAGEQGYDLSVLPVG